ncbi:hypothetical protein EXE44_04990 [Halorubrum sp. SS7]|uniref:hypothetical protein n=1 Tax=unclassified Halorubrum TaxID=2642239 RepID=UPI0010F942D9|nr:MULTISPECIES: hypothetical protein [unclassified Halorubrum]TKX58903.1 hypothetical protein EXE44_04990 [Halorubrum sp. SS7]TKX64377.1 hypothetical protein EXE45_16555 [Halorubrum sp. SP9]
MTDPAFVVAKRKTGNARNYRGDVNVSLGDQTVTFKHRLLNETEFQELQHALDTEEMASADEPEVDPEMGETEAQERLLELQEKPELTSEEEQELQELSEQVASQTSRIKDALGEDGFALLRQFGKEVIKPDDESVDHVYDLVKSDPAQAADLMGMDQLPSGGTLTKDEVREHLEDELERLVTGQPYPIKLNVGLQAMAETISVLGNGLQES